jgi:hypothetical protein
MIIHTNCSISDVIVETSMRLFLILDICIAFSICIACFCMEGDDWKFPNGFTEYSCEYYITIFDYQSSLVSLLQFGFG